MSNSLKYRGINRIRFGLLLRLVSNDLRNANDFHKLGLSGEKFRFLYNICVLCNYENFDKSARFKDEVDSCHCDFRSLRSLSRYVLCDQFQVSQFYLLRLRRLIQILKNVISGRSVGLSVFSAPAKLPALDKFCEWLLWGISGTRSMSHWPSWDDVFKICISLGCLTYF